MSRSFPEFFAADVRSAYELISAFKMSLVPEVFHYPPKHGSFRLPHNKPESHGVRFNMEKLLFGADFAVVPPFGFFWRTMYFSSASFDSKASP
jgi:hypothetical protein